MTKFSILIRASTHSGFDASFWGEIECEKRAIGDTGVDEEVQTWLYSCPLVNCKCRCVRDVNLWKCVHTPWQQA